MEVKQIMKKKTRKLIESVKSLIENYYPFLDENEQNELFEDFVYKSLKHNLLEAGVRNAEREIAAMRQRGATDQEITNYLLNNTGVYTQNGLMARRQYRNAGISPDNTFSQPHSVAFDKGLDYGSGLLKKAPNIPNNVAMNAGKYRVARRLDAYKNAYLKMLQRNGVDTTKPEIQNMLYNYDSRQWR